MWGEPEQSAVLITQLYKGGKERHSYQKCMRTHMKLTHEHEARVRILTLGSILDGRLVLPVAIFSVKYHEPAATQEAIVCLILQKSGYGN